MADDARRLDCRRDVTNTAEHVLVTEHACDPLRRVDAVLKGDNRRLRAYRRPNALGCYLCVPELDGDDDQVDGTHPLCTIRRLYGVHEQRRRVALDTQAVAEHRFQVLAARDEGHVVTACSQPRSEVSTEPARSYDEDLHSVSLRFFVSDSMWSSIVSMAASSGLVLRRIC